MKNKNRRGPMARKKAGKPAVLNHEVFYGGGIPYVELAFSSVNSLAVFLLLAAAVALSWSGEYAKAVLFLLAVLMIAVFRFVQAVKIEEAMAEIDGVARREIRSVGFFHDMRKPSSAKRHMGIKKISALFAGAGFCVLLMVFAIGLYRKIAPAEIFALVAAIAIIAVPATMLKNIKLAIAAGMWRILKKGAIIENLRVFENLANVDVICTDKTAILTKGIVQIDKIALAGSPPASMGDIRNEIKAGSLAGDNYKKVLRIGILCNNAEVEKADLEKEDISGASIDEAFLRLGHSAGLDIEEINKKSVRVACVPFDPQRKFMAVLNKEESLQVILAKGIAEEIISRSRFIFSGGKIKEIDEHDLRFLKQKQLEMSEKGHRVLGIAFRVCGKNDISIFKKGNGEDAVHSLVFVAFAAVSDPLRGDAGEALASAREMGIDTVIFTGDNSTMAKSVFADLGIGFNDDNIMDGASLDHMSNKELSSIVGRIKLYVQVSSRHKLRILRALQSQGKTVAMVAAASGDALALEEANVGAALKNADASAKEAADLILLDSSLRTIVDAAKESAVIFENIRKVIFYYIICLSGEIFVALAGLVVDCEMPLSSLQILWINIIIIGIITAALALGKRGRGGIAAVRRKFGASMGSEDVAISIFSGVMVGFTALFVFEYLRESASDIRPAGTMAFAIFSTNLIFLASNLRHFSVRIKKHGFFPDRYLAISAAMILMLQILVIYDPIMQAALDTVPLEIIDWEIIAASCVVVVSATEIVRNILKISK